MCWGRGDDVLDEEDRLPQLALVLEDFHCRLALGELDVLVELVEELVELDDARELDIFVLELHHETLLVSQELVGCAWLRLDLNLGGHVAPQVLELRVVVVLGIVRRHLCILVLARSLFLLLLA